MCVGGGGGVFTAPCDRAFSCSLSEIFCPGLVEC